MTVLCIAGSAIAALFAFGYTIRRDRDAVSVTVSVISACMGVSLGIAARRYGADPSLALPPVPVLSLLALGGAAVFSLSLRVVELDTERRRYGAPALAALGPAIVSDVVVHGLRLQARHADGMRLVVPLLHVAVGVMVMGLCVAAVVHVFRLHSPRTMSGLAWGVLGFSCVGIIALAVGLAGMATGNARLYAVMDGFTSIAVMVGALATFRYPAPFQRLRSETVARRYARSLLSGLDVEGLVSGMIAMVRKTRLYADDSCSLEELSRRMGLSRHQVSELLNDRMGTSFSDFMNGFRIEAAEELLVSRPDETILTVAMDVGFRNKTSFNEAFRRRTGSTPSQFRAQAAGKRQDG